VLVSIHSGSCAFETVIEKNILGARKGVARSAIPFPKADLGINRHEGIYGIVSLRGDGTFSTHAMKLTPRADGYIVICAPADRYTRVQSIYKWLIGLSSWFCLWEVLYQAYAGRLIAAPSRPENFISRKPSELFGMLFKSGMGKAWPRWAIRDFHAKPIHQKSLCRSFRCFEGTEETHADEGF